MLMLSSSRALGAPLKDAQLDPATLTQGGILADAEGKLRNAFNAIGRVSLRGGGVDGRLIAEYQHARAAFADAVQVWRTAHNQTPVGERNDPNEVMQLPPEIGVGTAGFGAASPSSTFVPLSQIMVKYGPPGQERTAGLGAVLQDPYFMYAQQGLGIGPLGFVLLTVLIVGATVAIVSALISDSDKAVIARQDAIRAQALAGAIDRAMQSMESMQVACMGSSTDPAVRDQCTKAATQAVLDSIGLIQSSPGFQPTAPDSGPSGWMILGGVAILAALGVAGVFVYRRLSTDDGAAMAGRRRRRSRRR